MRTTAGSRRSKRRCPRIKKLDSLEIEDPVAIEAQAAFAEISAETATQEAIRAAGWNAQAVASKTEPPPEAAPVESEYSFEALAALDSIIAREAPDEGVREAVEDPVADTAQASFAKTAPNSNLSGGSPNAVTPHCFPS